MKLFYSEFFGDALSVFFSFSFGFIVLRLIEFELMKFMLTITSQQSSRQTGSGEEVIAIYFGYAVCLVLNCSLNNELVYLTGIGNPFCAQGVRNPWSLSRQQNLPGKLELEVRGTQLGLVGPSTLRPSWRRRATFQKQQPSDFESRPSGEFS